MLTTYIQSDEEGTMTRRIFRTGNSAVVSLPADAMEAVGLGLGDEVTVVADPDRGHIIVAPATLLPGVRPGLLERVDRFIDRYSPTLETLAKE
jgi:antitoxin component of MazEF toxin-antitoxin module